MAAAGSAGLSMWGKMYSTDTLITMDQAVTPTQVMTNRVSTIVKNRSSSVSGHPGLGRSRQLFIKPPDHRGNSQTEGACSMSISLSPSHKHPPVSPPTNLPMIGNQVHLGNGTTAFVGKDSVDVVSVSSPTSSFKTPLPKQHVNTLKERLKISAAKSKAAGATNAGGCQYYPSSINVNNNIPTDNEVMVHTTYIQLSDSVETSSSADKLFSPAAKRMMSNRKPAKPIKKVGAKGIQAVRRDQAKPKKVLSSPSHPSGANMIPALTLMDTSRVPPRIFDRGDLLGSGGFAKVYRVVERNTSAHYADKVINKDIFKKRPNAREKVDREIQLHRKMVHKNIVKFYEFFEDTNFVHLILEVAPLGSLLNVSRTRGTVTEPEVRYYFLQIVAGTNYIHGQKILHRDLKLGNMFLSENMQVKIGDFGLSISFEENKTSLCGTPNYVSPEIIAKRGHSVASEVWSIGCIVYALLCGKPPFDSDSVETTYKLITECQFRLPDTLSSEAKDFLINILRFDPRSRGTLEVPKRGEVLNNSLLQHPFIVSGFIPACLPPSAVNTVPDFSEKIVITIPDSSEKDEIQGCSPGLRASLKRMKGFFNNRDDFILQVIDRLQVLIATPPASSHPVEHSQFLRHIPLYVSKWVDYTNRFGFVFKLSDGSVGVLFNDTTRLGLRRKEGLVEVTDMKGKQYTFTTDENSNSHIWPEVRSRIANLEAYTKYMDEFLNDTTISGEAFSVMTTSHKTSIPQLKRWHRTGPCIGMEFNNNMVQINFKEEHVKIILWIFENELLFTSLYDNRAMTLSLMTQASPVLPRPVRSVLDKAVRKLRDLHGISIRE